MERYGLIGRSLGHSFSKGYFSDKFAREGRSDHHYDLFELASIDAFPALVRNTRHLRGLNVTIPYKQEVAQFLTRMDPVAAAVGAVNTIRVDPDGTMTGYNTDVDGFRATLLPLIGQERPRALVLGSGGACRAVVYVLKELGIRFRVVSRTRDRGDLTWDLLDPTIMRACHLIINTTPVGMYPLVDEAPDLPYQALTPKHLAIDLIYNPERTRFLQLCQAQGARTVNGLTMLYAQAEASWSIWRS